MFSIPETYLKYLKYQKGMMNIAQTVGEKIMLLPEIELKTCFKLVIW